MRLASPFVVIHLISISPLEICITKKWSLFLPGRHAFGNEKRSVKNIVFGSVRIDSFYYGAEKLTSNWEPRRQISYKKKDITVSL